MSYEQMELDCRLDSERDLEENVIRVIDFAHAQLKASAESDSVKNRHEGYGLLSEGLDKITGSMKKVKDDMGKFLQTLPSDDFKAIDVVSGIGNSLTALAVAAIRAAAEARRVGDDLFERESTAKTPLEEYYGSTKADDGFEETQEDE